MSKEVNLHKALDNVQLCYLNNQEESKEGVRIKNIEQHKKHDSYETINILSSQENNNNMSHQDVTLGQEEEQINETNDEETNGSVRALFENMSDDECNEEEEKLSKLRCEDFNQNKYSRKDELSHEIIASVNSSQHSGNSSLSYEPSDSKEDKTLLEMKERVTQYRCVLQYEGDVQKHARHLFEKCRMTKEQKEMLSAYCEGRQQKEREGQIVLWQKGEFKICLILFFGSKMKKTFEVVVFKKN